jgi:hypothetical protein
LAATVLIQQSNAIFCLLARSRMVAGQRITRVENVIVCECNYSYHTRNVANIIIINVIIIIIGMLYTNHEQPTA